jgi:hypothetical protein
MDGLAKNLLRFEGVYLERKNNRVVNNHNENRNSFPTIEFFFNPSFAKEAVIQAAGGTSSSRSRKHLRKIGTE